MMKEIRELVIGSDRPARMQSVLRLVTKGVLPIVAVFAFLILRYAFNRFAHNDADVLPSARQFLEPDWLPSDWYLNLKIGYRYAFNAVAGILCRSLPFPLANFWGRVIVALLFALSFYRLFKALKISFLLVIPCLWYFAQQQGFFADEWFLLRLEAKCFAYAFVIMGVAFLLEEKYSVMLASLGAALSFHVLVGIYACFCVGAVIVLNTQHRKNGAQILKRLPVLAVTGCFGVYAVLSQIFANIGADPTEAILGATIYVTFRVPHHVFPPAFGPVEDWGVHLVFFLVPVAAFLFSGNERFKQVAQFVFSSLLLCAVGFVLFKLQWYHLLKYYWFRFGSAMVPFVGAVAIAGLLHVVFENGWQWLAALSSRHGLWKLLSNGLAGLVLSVLVASNAALIVWPKTAIKDGLSIGPNSWEILKRGVERRPKSAFGAWIQKNTPRDAIFLVDPVMDNFYLVAERARVVSFKHSPQSEKDILEWHGRLLDITDSQSIDKMGFSSQRVLRRRYCRLSDDAVDRLVEKYSIQYIVFKRCKARLDYPVVYRDARHTVYKTGS
jgi:hypothetical protein